MTLSRRRPGAARAQNGLARAKFRKHKVIMESITQKKKKLRSIIYFEAEAPAGYTFIPAGNPQFTAACKEICRNQGLKVFAVTTTPHQKTHGLSQQVHRVGYHFPSTVVARACMELGFYLTENGNVLSINKFNVEPTNEHVETEASQITINTEARDVIRDLFPNIPDDDLNQIIKTAFQKGQRKVGTAVELPLARRAQLAVVAHVRHIYTDYDRLLKKTSFQEARRKVEDSTLEKLVQWRGEDENGMPELEDVFREVIVISDDEDEDDDDDDDNDEEDKSHSSHVVELNTTDREPNIEILSSDVITNRLETEDEKENHSTTSLLGRPSGRPSTEELTKGYRLVHRGPSQIINRSKIDRRGFSRYEAWDRAMGRYRERRSFKDHEHDSFRSHVASKEEGTGPQWAYNGTVDKSLEQQPMPAGSILQPRFKSIKESFPSHNGDELYTEHLSKQYDDDRTYSSLSRRKAPDILHFPDGSVFSKIPSIMPEERVFHSEDITATPVFVAGPSLSFDRHYENPRKRIHPSGILATNYARVDLSSQDNTIFPSIEGPDFSAAERSFAKSRVSDSSNAQRAVHKDVAMQRAWRVEDLSRKVDFINLTDDSNDYSKRRRLQHEQVSDLRRPLSCENIAPHRFVEKRIPKLPPPTARSRYVEQTLDNSDTYRLPVTTRDSNPLKKGYLEQNLHTISRPEAPLNNSSGEAVLEPSGNYIREDRRYVLNSYLDTLEQSKGAISRDNNRLVDLPRNEIARQTHTISQPYFGRGTDDAGWRSKANYYEYQRGLIDAEDFPRPSSANHPQLRPSLLQSSERHELHLPHFHRTASQRLSPGPLSWAPPSSREIHGLRASSQGSVSVAQKRKDTLPVSAIRRYEVQLERPKNS